MQITAKISYALCFIGLLLAGGCGGKDISAESPASNAIPVGIKVVFIEIGSVNCVPCQMMQPVMKEIEQEYGNQVKVDYYDVWTPEGKPYGEKYNIRVIPTHVFLDAHGKEYFRHEGFFPKDELVAILKQKGGVK
ncbi:MAG: thioredoxin family protein [Spirochaetales bacterium]|nr:thioredoxin family protein [Spirochaetales bacterium]